MIVVNMGEKQDFRFALAQYGPYVPSIELSSTSKAGFEKNRVGTGIKVNRGPTQPRNVKIFNYFARFCE